VACFGNRILIFFLEEITQESARLSCLWNAIAIKLIVARVLFFPSHYRIPTYGS
jgi:hypothetical protein